MGRESLQRIGLGVGHIARLQQWHMTGVVYEAWSNLKTGHRQVVVVTLQLGVDGLAIELIANGIDDLQKLEAAEQSDFLQMRLRSDDMTRLRASMQSFSSFPSRHGEAQDALLDDSDARRELNFVADLIQFKGSIAALEGHGVDCLDTLAVLGDTELRQLGLRSGHIIKLRSLLVSCFTDCSRLHTYQQTGPTHWATHADHAVFAADQSRSLQPTKCLCGKKKLCVKVARGSGKGKCENNDPRHWETFCHNRDGHADLCFKTNGSWKRWNRVNRTRGVANLSHDSPRALICL